MKTEREYRSVMGFKRYEPLKIEDDAAPSTPAIVEALPALVVPSQAEVSIPAPIDDPEPEPAPQPAKPKHAGGRPRKALERANVKLSKEQLRLTKDMDRSALIRKLLDAHFGIVESDGEEQHDED